ncbi:MAG TPA: T9SS type A sorting domain-containing protein, partial [Flavisolibacter sp.]|nr:T9SS type A sorting domain-containing protein [Flavisolibacter sp.]
KVQPSILDPTPANVNNNSVQGVDRLNNIEQVVINSPVAGDYTVNIKGTTITQTPTQNYYIVYDIIPNTLALTFPTGGEGLPADRSTRIQWESYGDPVSTYHLEYSSDEGITWATVDNAISATANSYLWKIPASATEKARLRISKNETSLSSSSNSFTIIGQPVVSLATTQCPSYMAIQWPAITGATDYEILRLSGGEMIPVGTTTSTAYTLNSLSTDSVYWVAVRARINGRSGLRSNAISRQPTNGNCSGNISNNDLKLDAILSPVSGRKETSSALTSATQVKVRIRNLDNVAISNFTVRYSIDGGANWVTETLAKSIPALGTYEHTFTTPADMSALDIYEFVASVVNTNPDPVTANNTITTTIRHLDNPPVDLTTNFLDDLESAAIRSYQADTIGLMGLDRYDFINNTINGRLRTFVNSGIAASGTKAITLDANRTLTAPGNTNYLIGTFNLSGYTTANEIRLGFKYNQHGQLPNSDNRVWIRGNDDPATPWIEVYNLDNAPEKAGIYKSVTSIEVSDLLAANAQGFTSSFQIRWGQTGTSQAVNKESASGFTLDDIRLYQVQNDMQLVSIDAPKAADCGLSSKSAVIVSVRNTMNAEVKDLPIQYRLNGGEWINEVIPSIPANTTLQYTFTATADLSAFITYKIEVNVSKEGDSFVENNSAEATVINLPLITAFPHLENFEATNGYWYSEGANTSWAHGKPAATLINTAASGTKAWKTNLSGNYNDNERSFLYSPCYDIRNLSNPTLSFSVAMDIEDCGTTLCDRAFIEYSTDGIIWSKLGASGTGTNWYNKAGTQELWSKEHDTNWHVATIPLPVGHNRLRLRFVFNSDPGLNKEGLAIDDIHIYDRNVNGIYSGTTISTPIQENVSGGTSWINFTQNGALVASIQPNNQNLGVTAVQAFMNTGAMRFTTNQYYANRNITIKPTTTSLLSPVKVRYYFTDAEAQNLINASGCTSCSRPADPYRIGISKWSHKDGVRENGTIDDNIGGVWSFIPPANLKVIPYDNGYYAEFDITSFSELWLSAGPIDAGTPLPITLVSFTGQRQGDDALLKWSVTESDIIKYEVEVAQEASNQFRKVGEVISRGNSTTLQQYSFIDTEPNKLGTRLYRLKVLEEDGSFTYTPIRPVLFADPVNWQVYPNPSNGLFYLTYHLNTRAKFEAHVYDSKGRLVQQYTKEGNGGWQKLAIDLSSSALSSGIYLLRVTTDGKQQYFKLTKQ